MPSSIDYITNKTGYDSVFYIGHSQGSTASFVMLSERPEYNSKIKLLICLAPTAFMSNCPNPVIKFIPQFSDSLEVRTIRNDNFVKLVY